VFLKIVEKWYNFPIPENSEFTNVFIKFTGKSKSPITSKFWESKNELQYFV